MQLLVLGLALAAVQLRLELLLGSGSSVCLIECPSPSPASSPVQGPTHRDEDRRKEDLKQLIRDKHLLLLYNFVHPPTLFILPTILDLINNIPLI